MGEPKALLRLAPDTPTLLERVAGRVGEVVAEVMLVGRADWSIPPSLADLRCVLDGGDGAADGVIAALGAARSDTCLVVGCDMPFLDVALLREMIALSQREGKGGVARDATGLHPLHAVWRRQDLPRIERLVATGERSLATIARSIEMVPIDLADRDPAARWSVFNVNTPADLEVARSHVNP